MRSDTSNLFSSYKIYFLEKSWPSVNQYQTIVLTNYHWQKFPLQINHVNAKYPTLFANSKMHSSIEEWRAEFCLLILSSGLDASMEHCKHLHKCLTKSLIAVTIASEACNLTSWARRVATWIMSICISGCLVRFLWSKCLTTRDNNKWLFCSGKYTET